LVGTIPCGCPNLARSNPLQFPQDKPPYERIAGLSVTTKLLLQKAKKTIPTKKNVPTTQNSLDRSVIPKEAMAQKGIVETLQYNVLGTATAFGIVADSETLLHDEAPNPSLQIKKIAISHQ